MFDQVSKSAFESLIHSAYRYACALQVDSGEAQGLVHDAWINASKKKGRLPDKAYLFRCVRNLYIDQYRRSQIVPVESVHDDKADYEQFVGVSDVAELPDIELQQALHQLRDVERETLFLSVVEGYTTSEIAKLTGMPRGSVLSLIHRARIKLRKIMDNETNVTPIKAGNSRDSS